MNARPWFVKWGGSLITHKTRPRTVRRQVLRRLADELAAFRAAHPDVPILLGHGSGSFGHWAARAHNWQGRTPPAPADWKAVMAVAQAAAELHAQVLETLRAAGIPAWSFPPSASVLAHNGQIRDWNIATLAHALQTGWVPVVYGDVVLDTRQGGAILSTEDLFMALAPLLRPTRLLLAGQEPGVWRAWPQREDIWSRITPAEWAAAQRGMGAAQGVDVTGGMAGKVARMVALVQQHPDVEVRIFSGLSPGTFRRALEGEPVGTLISAATPSGGGQGT